jgi:hypothetical protein
MSDNGDLISKIYDHIETRHTDNAVIACFRLSKNIGDIFNTIIFIRELYPDKRQLHNIFYDEVNHLKKNTQEFLWKTTGEHWIDERTMPYSIVEGEQNKTVLPLGVAEIEKELAHLQQEIADLNIPSGMGEYDTAAFTDRYDATKTKLRLRMSAISTIQERIRTRCLNYASRVEKQIKAQEKPSKFLSNVQNVVNNYFSAHSEETYRKLQKASSLVDSNNAEDFALLLTSVRRAINAIADYFYPPKKGKVICSDGVKRSMGNNQYLNRLHEHCSTTFKSTTSNELIQAELNCLMTFVKKLNETACKGVHSEVSSSEAKQGLVGLYMFLFNVIQKIDTNDA